MLTMPESTIASPPAEPEKKAENWSRETFLVSIVFREDCSVTVLRDHPQCIVEYNEY